MSKNFNKLIESTIEDYAKAVSKKFNISHEELMDIWYGNTRISNDSSKPVKIVSSTTKPSNKSDIDFESDSEDDNKESKPKPVQKSKSSSKDETSLESLKKKAKELGIPGISKFKASNKDELIELIDKAEKGGSSSVTKSSVKSKSPPKKQVVKEEPKVTTEYVQKKLASFSVSKNNFGNYWNESSGIVFDKVTRQAIGKQQPNGDVTNLTKQDIEFCKNNNISYKLPTNIISEEKEERQSDDEESVDDDEDEFDEDELDDEDN